VMKKSEYYQNTWYLKVIFCLTVRDKCEGK
jgi:hypothetical protein